MTSSLELVFDRRPSAAAFMLRALLRAPRRGGTLIVPPICARWKGYAIDPQHLDTFLRLTGLPRGPELSLLYPHVFGFPLLMVVLTHRAYPLPIWNALQIRNHFLQHHPLRHDSVVDLQTAVTAQRVLEKGLEVDLHTLVTSQGELAWEGLCTFYYRGRFGTSSSPSPLAIAPAFEASEHATWPTTSAPGPRFAQLTGDYNGIHRWHWYARRLGFRGALHHPQLVLGQCLAHLPFAPAQGPLRLDAWLKGPVFYGDDVHLRTADRAGESLFTATPSGETRPALVGRLRAAALGESLIRPANAQCSR